MFSLHLLKKERSEDGRVMVDKKFASLLENLKVEDPWLPPKTWESIRCESGVHSFPKSNQPLCHLSTLSESSLVRLAMNAMQGAKSSLVSIQKLSAIFSCDPADRTFLQIPNLWNRASSTPSLANLLLSIGCTGSLVFLLRAFVDYFTNMNLCQTQIHQDHQFPPFTLVNQAFAVAVGKILEGYICGLDTIHASVVLRRSSKHVDLPLPGCLKNVVHSEITLLEFYLHIKELKTQIEALASICNLQKWALCFSDTAFEDLITEATSEFRNFCRGGNLLTFLFAQLQVADPAHCTLLKFLFLQSCEPYCGFIRSWIFKAEIHDPYKEFIVENMECLPPKSHVKAGNSVDSPLASVKVRDGVPVPGFLKDFLVPLVRAGQQLQVLLKLLEMCIHVADGEHSCDDFLPCWSGFSSSSLSYSSPLAFSKDVIEAMVLARENYYKRMNEKIESLLSSLEVRYQQVAMCASVPSFDNGGGTLDKLGQIMSENEFVGCPTADKRNILRGIGNLGSDVSSTTDDSLLEDMCGLSESSSLNSSEEQLDCDQLSGWSCPVVEQQNHLSALRFLKTTTLNNSIENSCHHENFGSDSCGICDKVDATDHLVKSSYEGVILSHMSNPINQGNSSCSCKFSIQYRESLIDSCSAMGHLLKKSFHNDGTVDPKVTEKHLGSLRYSMACHDVITVSDTLNGEATNEDRPDNNLLTSHLYSFQPLKYGHQCNHPSINPLSVNPMLTRNSVLHLMGRNGEKYKADHVQHLPYFNFSTVEDPCKVYMDKLSTNSRCRSASSFTLDSTVSAHDDKNKEHGEIGCGREDGLVDVPKLCIDASLDLMDHKHLTVVSGGSSWERLLGSFGKTVNCDDKRKQTLLSTFEIPLDIIIDKCLLQEIMLQYNYVSKLAINVLEEAFKLQEHLLALRRYHFMELADWADLFILSLWHHKWSVTEANERLSEIQGLLELSIQKSSCEHDIHKDRLFVYMKGHGKLPLSASAIGVRSFDFLGLGYHVDWPLSIVLTPAALKIYADIFSFLIQVKLAIFSLTDVWCSLKDLVHTTNKDQNSEQHQLETGHLNILIKMSILCSTFNDRHQISHFVSTLQQYVESQLSHVSWCRFLNSLQHKVKDMMDLESVHMEYLADSLCICFLSDETKAVGSIIESILQCALDFRSCITVGAWDSGSDLEDLLGKLSRINISQVLSIKQKFDRSLKELHICYIKGPKHGNFGLSRFWDYLNYNEYYLNVKNEMGYYYAL
ncbi:Gamma-tubulin complex component 6, partial [Mucuna pruriens]